MNDTGKKLFEMTAEELVEAHANAVEDMLSAQRAERYGDNVARRIQDCYTWEQAVEEELLRRLNEGGTKK